MRLVHQFLKCAGRSGCVLFPLFGYANAQEFPSVTKDVLDIGDYAKAKAAGNATSKQAKQAAEAIDSVATDMSHAVAVAGAIRNPVAGVPTAVLGSALMPITKSIQERGMKIIGIQGELENAVISRDYSRIAELQEQQDAITAEGANWRPSYGSSQETISRLSQGIELGSSNHNISTLEKIGKRILSDIATAVQSFDDGFPKQKQSGEFPAGRIKPQEHVTPNVGEQLPSADARKPICGTLEWQYQVGSTECDPSGLEVDENPPHQKQYGWRLADRNECSPLPLDFKEFADLQISDDKLYGCPVVKKTYGDNRISFLFNCANQMGGMALTKVSEDKIQSNAYFEDGQSYDHTYLLCEMEDEEPEIDCSAAGQRAWRAKNNGAPAFMCKEPL